MSADLSNEAGVGLQHWRTLTLFALSGLLAAACGFQANDTFVAGTTTTAPETTVTAPETTMTAPETTMTALADADPPTIEEVAELLSNASLSTRCWDGETKATITLVDGSYYPGSQDPTDDAYLGYRRIRTESLEAPAIGKFSGGARYEVATVSSCSPGGNYAESVLDLWALESNDIRHLGEYLGQDNIMPVSVAAMDSRLVLELACEGGPFICDPYDGLIYPYEFLVTDDQLTAAPSGVAICTTLQELQGSVPLDGIARDFIFLFGQGDQSELPLRMFTYLPEGADPIEVQIGAAVEPMMTGPAWELIDSSAQNALVTNFAGQLVCN